MANRILKAFVENGGAAAVLSKILRAPIAILDVRDSGEFNKWHIRGSKNIPFRSQSTSLDQRLFELCPRHKPLTILCDFKDLTLVAYFFASRPTPWTIPAIIPVSSPESVTVIPPFESAMSHSNLSPSCYLHNEIFNKLNTLVESAETLTKEMLESYPIREMDGLTIWESRIVALSEHLDEDQKEKYLVFDKCGGLQMRASLELLCDFSSAFGSKLEEKHEESNQNAQESQRFFKRQKRSNCSEQESPAQPDVKPLTQGDFDAFRKCFDLFPSIKDLLELEELMKSNQELQDEVGIRLRSFLGSRGWSGWAAPMSASETKTEHDSISWDLLDKQIHEAMDVAVCSRFITIDKNQTGISPVVLFHPNPLLEDYISFIEKCLQEQVKENPREAKYDSSAERYPAALDLGDGSTKAFTCLDIGCGQGRDSLWLALRGQSQNDAWRIMSVDEVPMMLESLKRAACDNNAGHLIAPLRARIRADGVIAPRCNEQKFETPLNAKLELKQRCLESQREKIETTEKADKIDLSKTRPLETPAGTLVSNAGNDVFYPWFDRTFDLVVLVRFHSESLLTILPKLVSQGGFIVYSHFYEGCSHPANVVKPNQLQSVFSEDAGFRLVTFYVDHFPDGRPFANFIAQRIR